MRRHCLARAGSAPGEGVPAAERLAARLPARLPDVERNRPEPPPRPLEGVAVVAARVPAEVEHDPFEAEVASVARTPPGELRLVVAAADQAPHPQHEHAIHHGLLDRRSRIIHLSSWRAEESDVLVFQRLAEAELQLADRIAPRARTSGQAHLPRR